MSNGTVHRADTAHRGIFCVLLMVVAGIAVVGAIDYLIYVNSPQVLEQSQESPG